MKPIIIYITGFRQHAGKTTTSLGLLALLKKHLSVDDIGYIKPVGQELVSLPDGSKIDKDVRIIDHFIKMKDFDSKMASPVRLGSGFTKDFLNSNNKEAESQILKQNILDSFKALENKKIIVAEGTGHPGVGGIVGLSNAEVSNLVQADIIFLSGGGIGKALDMLEVDLSYFHYKKSRVRGLIFNKCLPDKIDQVKHYLSEDLINKMYGRFEHSLKVFGYLPEVEQLYKPSMLSIRDRFQGSKVIGDSENPHWEKSINQIRVISLSIESISLEKYFLPGDLLMIGSAAEDKIRKIIEWNRTLESRGQNGLGGLILTCGETTCPSDKITLLLEESGIPVLYIPDDTARAEHIVEDCIENAKIQLYDFEKFTKVQSIFEEYFDLDKFIETFKIKI